VHEDRVNAVVLHLQTTAKPASPPGLQLCGCIESTRCYLRCSMRRLCSCTPSAYASHMLAEHDLRQARASLSGWQLPPTGLFSSDRGPVAVLCVLQRLTSSSSRARTREVDGPTSEPLGPQRCTADRTTIQVVYPNASKAWSNVALWQDMPAECRSSTWREHCGCKTAASTVSSQIRDALVAERAVPFVPFFPLKEKHLLCPLCKPPRKI
jgi:hypothetical protein